MDSNVKPQTLVETFDQVLMIYEINHIWTAEMKWKWRNDRRSERNLCNCVKKPEKIQDFNGVSTRDPAINSAMLYQLSYEATDVGSRSIFFQASLRNCINCVHCDDHFFIFISFPQFIYDLFHISFLSWQHINPQFTSFQRQWLHSSVGRASHGITKSRVQTSLKSWIFSGFFTQLHKLRSLRRSFLHFQNKDLYVYWLIRL